MPPLPFPDPVADTSWMALGACIPVVAEALAADKPDPMFPEARKSPVAGKRVCLSCHVTIECRTYAVATEQPAGIWGGQTADERLDTINAHRVMAGMEPLAGYQYASTYDTGLDALRPRAERTAAVEQAEDREPTAADLAAIERDNLDGMAA